MPIMVGSLSTEYHKEVARLLGHLFRDKRTLFVISSDFCHWGKRFDYQPHDRSQGAVYESIEKLDREAMELIEQQDAEGFHAYLRRTHNTIW